MKKTLADAKSGEIVEITGCFDMQTKCQLMRFGLAIGEFIKCLTQVGPVIIEKNKQTIAIGRNLAVKILI